MPIAFDPAKRAATLRERGLDFCDAAIVFAGVVVEEVDSRVDYGERRVITVGFLGPRMVVVVWTPRGDDQHVISMRKANEREQGRYAKQLGRS